MMISDNVAANLRAVRLRLRLSQEEVARKAGLSVSYISMLERGQRSPPLDTLAIVARVLGVTPAVLLEQARLR